MELTPLQDILRYTARTHGFKYAVAIQIALMIATPDETHVAEFGTLAATELAEFQAELSIEG